VVVDPAVRRVCRILEISATAQAHLASLLADDH